MPLDSDEIRTILATIEDPEIRRRVEVALDDIARIVEQVRVTIPTRQRRKRRSVLS